jgi:hypothetical protein
MAIRDCTLWGHLVIFRRTNHIQITSAQPIGNILIFGEGEHNENACFIPDNGMKQKQWRKKSEAHSASLFAMIVYQSFNAD